ncbi:DUF4407 domain-containing protein [Dyadobacter frigoris]|uniref:DUF4407 domain-containing protein n=1 Tax=Dyadobacter frigoris TaxID=2576211 RepID=A0A4U6CQY5_9BACT|nr:DUF4407 domain-containing protein [Dyadobacter frigoris]TKT85258.1 DUF4407 domain-containing protein [Dyadobacter frigoris]
MQIFETQIQNPPKMVRATNVSKHSDARSRLISFSIAIPVILWFWNGFFIAQTALSKPTIICLCTGCMCALLVFLVERTIADSTSRSVIVITARIFLAICLSICGIVGLKLQIYNQDIEQVLKIKQIAKEDSLSKSFDQTSEVRKKPLVDDLKYRTSETLRLNKKLIDEIQGKDGSQTGVGSIADGIRIELDTARNYEKRAQIILKTAEDTVLVEKTQFIKESKLPWGIKHRLAVLHGIIFEDAFNIIFFIALACTLLILDLILVFVAYTEPISPQEIVKNELYSLYKHKMDQKNLL